MTKYPLKVHKSSALRSACKKVYSIVFQKDNQVNQTSLQPVLTASWKGWKDLRQFHEQTQQMASTVYAAWHCSISKGLHMRSSVSAWSLAAAAAKQKQSKETHAVPVLFLFVKKHVLQSCVKVQLQTICNLRIVQKVI